MRHHQSASTDSEPTRKTSPNEERSTPVLFPSVGVEETRRSWITVLIGKEGGNVWIQWNVGILDGIPDGQQTLVQKPARFKHGLQFNARMARQLCPFPRSDNAVLMGSVNAEGRRGRVYGTVFPTFIHLEQFPSRKRLYVSMCIHLCVFYQWDAVLLSQCTRFCIGKKAKDRYFKEKTLNPPNRQQGKIEDLPGLSVIAAFFTKLLNVIFLNILFPTLCSS